MVNGRTRSKRVHIYSSVRCNKPPAVRNANIMAHFKGEYFLSTMAEYSCKEGFKMKQSRSIRCMYNGQWSTPPQCFPASQMQLPTSFKSKLFVTILFTHFILGMVLTLRYQIKLQGKQKSTVKRELVQFDANFMELKEIEPLLPLKRVDFERNRFFDAIVFYHFDSDDDFVVDHLLPELEEARDFKLYTRARYQRQHRGSHREQQ